MRIGIVIWSLYENIGGLERVGRDLALAILARGHDVCIFHKKPAAKNDLPVFQIPESVPLIPLDLGPYTNSLAAARQAVADSNIDVLAALFSWTSLLWFPALMNGSGISFVISEHSVLNHKFMLKITHFTEGSYYEQRSSKG